MINCKQCGAPMGDNAITCGKCGAPTEKAPELIKDELLKKLERFKALLGEASELGSQIKPQSEFPSEPNADFKKRTLMKYLWPYLVGGIGAASVLYLIIVIATMVSAVNSGNYKYSRYGTSSLDPSSLMGSIYGGYFLAALVGVAIIFIGIIIAKKKRNSFNTNADYMIREYNQKYQEGVRNQQMSDRLNKLIREMSQYEELVPVEYQDCEKLGKIIDQIKSGKAYTVEEAISQLA